MPPPSTSPSDTLPPGELAEAPEEPVAPSTLSSITDRDSQLSRLTALPTVAAALLEGEEEEVTNPREHHDLAPVHNILVQLAVSLQARVDQAARDLAGIRLRLAGELRRTAEVLGGLGEVKLPPGFPPSPPCAASARHLATLSSIHQYRDHAIAALSAQAAALAPAPAAPPAPQPGDFNSASDRLDLSFQQLRRWLDQLGAVARALQSCDGESNALRRFSSEQCREIDALEKEAVLVKMGELSVRNCSIQSRKPVRSLGHTLDLQEIMLLAKNAKSLVYEVSLQLLKVVDLVKGEEIAATTAYHRLTKENSELLRRYCFYLKLKIHQL